MKNLTSRHTSGDLLSTEQREAHEEALRLAKEEKAAALLRLLRGPAAASGDEVADSNP